MRGATRDISLIITHVIHGDNTDHHTRHTWGQHRLNPLPYHAFHPYKGSIQISGDCVDVSYRSSSSITAFIFPLPRPLSLKDALQGPESLGTVNEDPTSCGRPMFPGVHRHNLRRSRWYPFILQCFHQQMKSSGPQVGVVDGLPCGRILGTAAMRQCQEYPTVEGPG